MEWLHRQLLHLKLYSRFIEWTKGCILPGFSPLPLYTVATFFFREIGKDALVNKSSSLAYSFMLAIFPGIIFLFTLIPFIPIKGFQDQLLNLIQLVLPHNAFDAFETTLKDIIKKQNTGLLSFGFFSALFFATNGVKNLMKAFNKSSLIIETRGWIKQRLIALILTIIICFSIIICISAMALGEVLLNKINDELHLKDSFLIYTIKFTRWALLAILYFITISILYRYGPSHTKKWRLFSAGSWLATILAFLTIWGFSFYINHFASYNKVYGSIGTLIVVMIWLYLNSLILLIGFELNASVDVSKRSVKIIRPTFNLFKKSEPIEENIQKK
ncbi:YihY/virulence factor BrkB family protein [Pedobacter riviphilus]|uniref:YihY/virulence factor BrkB family protein n=1 Tax=Pedobacter riviphilus TaxID=2766984 RepID=A0ABX6TPF3_9SPHI|nr:MULTISPECIES: YihY/virulence factor BrkB family protein [Pedobacter]NII82570.1 membrane protein [Pedobacter sp. SG908]NMN36590.1 membrane protein [Pedobacter sp. SG918]QNR86315.1 YihY/virulence factor BrkB family protein [Pedobacter riviphilus]